MWYILENRWPKKDILKLGDKKENIFLFATTKNLFNSCIICSLQIITFYNTQNCELFSHLPLNPCLAQPWHNFIMRITGHTEHSDWSEPALLPVDFSRHRRATTWPLVKFYTMHVTSSVIENEDTRLFCIGNTQLLTMLGSYIIGQVYFNRGLLLVSCLKHSD